MSAMPPGPREMLALLARETQVRAGPLMTALDGVAVLPGEQRLADGRYLLVGRSGFSCFYRKGEGVLLGGYSPEHAGELALYLVGSVHAAVACLNGLLPIHASAVAAGGQAIAFTAPSGGGKSTLVTGLGDLGMPLFCDDTLVLHLGAPDAVHALPGHKRVKLWPEALALTGREPLELVSPDYPKYYATPTAGDVAEPLPLGALVFLREGPEPGWRRLSGGEAIAAFADDHYTRKLFDAANPHSRAERFALHARIARQVPMFEFTRPLEPARFRECCAFLAGRIAAITRP